MVATQDFDSLFEDYVKEIISSEPIRPPAFKQKIANAEASWFECSPGMAHISTSGGTPDDRHLAELVLQEQLAAHGFKRAAYTLEWDHSDPMTKTAGWPDIEAKAKRLIDTGKVQILRNGATSIVGHVEGDHGNYQTEVSREDPNSQAISLWQCECPWDQFAWQRTRQWKKYEGRVCAHVLATYWKALATPLDEEYEPGGGEPSPGTPNPSAPGGAAPVVQGPGAFQPNMQGAQPSPGSQAPMPPGVAAPPPELMPEFPGNPALQPAINPVSVPGQKPQTPLNPVQNAGGTFSRVANEEEFVNGAMVVNKNAEFGTAVGLNAGETVEVPKNSVGEVLGQDPSGLVEVYFAGPMGERGQLEPHGVQAFFFPGELTLRPDIRAPGPAIRRR